MVLMIGSSATALKMFSLIKKMMIDTLIKVLRINTAPDFARLVKNGAQIIDVRTRNEYAAGHIAGSINIPLNELKDKVITISKTTVLITCCASGVRSASARNVLQGLGYKNVYNGGGWQSLKNHLN